jgi:hypothetical protein
VGTRRVVLLRSSLLIAALGLTVLAAPAGAADFSRLGVNYGGGVFAGAGDTASQGTTAIGIRRESKAGDVLAIRLSVVLPCRPPAAGGLRGSDLSVTTRLRPDGTFSIDDQPARTTGEVGRVRVTLQGTLRVERADGTAKIASSLRCGGQVRTWSARPFDVVGDTGNPTPPADGVVYGLTNQSRQGGPHGFVAQVSGGGTQVQAFTSYTEKCQGRDRRGSYTATATVQDFWKAEPFSDALFKRRDVSHQTAAARRRGIRSSVITQVDAIFAGYGHLDGMISDDTDWRHGSLFERCYTAFSFSAAP